MVDDINPDDLEIADELIAERRSAAPGEKLPDDMPKWMAKIITFIDISSLWIGKTVCWFMVPLCAAMVYEVIARKFFIAPTMWAYDISRMSYGAMFMLGAGYALMRGVHIRADFLYRNWSAKTQGTVDTFLYLVLFFPGMIVFFYMSFEYASTSLMRGERSMDTAWMPYIGPIKSAIPLGIFFLTMQGVSEVFKSIYAMRKGRWPV